MHNSPTCTHCTNKNKFNHKNKKTELTDSKMCFKTRVIEHFTNTVVAYSN